MIVYRVYHNVTRETKKSGDKRRERENKPGSNNKEKRDATKRVTRNQKREEQREGETEIL